MKKASLLRRKPITATAFVTLFALSATTQAAPPTSPDLVQEKPAPAVEPSGQPRSPSDKLIQSNGVIHPK
jgi:hypothetical protein